LAIITARDRKAAQRQLTAVDQPKGSAIVTARKPGARHSLEPEMTPEEHKRRGDAADALFHEMKRKIAKKLRS
jgi:hypothetical protein